MSRPEFLTNDVSRMIADIYDCAVDPARWEATLNNICAWADLSYMQLYFWDRHGLSPEKLPRPITFQSTWDMEWLAKLPAALETIPKLDAWANADIDTPITQFEVMPESVVRETEFYRTWVMPQGLRDSCITKILERTEVTCMMTAASGDHRDVQGDHERNLMRALSPHIRRSLLISDMVDKGKLQLELYQRLLDQLSAGVFLLQGDCRILHANSAANDSLSSSGPLGEVSGRLWPHAAPARDAFQNAVQRASLCARRQP